jgi:hypothetical protein
VPTERELQKARIAAWAIPEGKRRRLSINVAVELAKIPELEDRVLCVEEILTSGQPVTKRRVDDWIERRFGVAERERVTMAPEIRAESASALASRSLRNAASAIRVARERGGEVDPRTAATMLDLTAAIRQDVTSLERVLRQAVESAAR